MATPAMKIADVVKNTAFAKYFRQKLAEKSALIRSGVVSSDPALANVIAANGGVGGTTVNLPFWNDIIGEDEVLSDITPLTAGKITAGQDVAVCLRRGRAWSVSDLAADFACDDPVAAIADRIADYWSRRRQASVFSVLKGVFADNVANDGGDLFLDISGEVGDDAVLNKNTLNMGAQKLGDAKDMLVAVAMHSMAEARLNEVGGSAYVARAADNPAALSRYNGRAIIMDDSVPYDSSTGVATIYLFGAGAIALNDVPTKVPFEAGRDILSSMDVLATRNSWIAHVRGVKWRGVASGATPTNAELELAASWDRVYERKSVRSVAIRCKIA
jgi:hypothetical protein